jgi:hypothetical protein
MKRSIDYVFEKLIESVYLLATGKGDVRSRLRDVYLVLHPARKSYLPDEFAIELESILTDLTSKNETIDRNGDVITGRLDATLQSMKNATGEKIAKRILALRYQVEYLVQERGN